MTSPLRKREVHKMKGLGYFEKLSLAAHWFLPREEAEDTIRDYRELLEDMGEKAFKRKFGGPVRAAVFSADKRKIWMWQGACGFFCCLGNFWPLDSALVSIHFLSSRFSTGRRFSSFL